MKAIHILSGPVQSGKTTNLKFWCSRRDDTKGILAPVSEGRRFLFDISGRQSRPLQPEGESAEPVRVGDYTFDNSVFAWGRDILEAALQEAPRWLVVDEIGPLELSGTGLEPAVSRIIAESAGKDIRLLLVVREKLLEKMILHYDLEPSLIRRLTLSDLKYLD